MKKVFKKQILRVIKKCRALIFKWTSKKLDDFWEFIFFKDSTFFVCYLFV